MLLTTCQTSTTSRRSNPHAVVTMTRVWMDQGGTFTDVVRVSDDGTVQIEKVLSQTACLTALAEGATDVRRGTTAATNALLEGKTPPVLLITNSGFEDLPWIGDGR